MKADLYFNENTIVAFHIGRGGRFNNPGYLTCTGTTNEVFRNDEDGEYDTTYSVKLSDIDYESKEAHAMVNDSDPITREQAILYFIDGETEENARAIMSELRISIDEQDKILGKDE